VTVVECGDFDCPYCARASKTIDRLLGEYPTQIAFHFAHMPLPFHATAEPAARAAVAADRQGKFWEMHDVLFRETTKRTEADFIGFAREIGLDVDKFKTDFAATDVADLVATQAQKLCKDNDATATPTFFVNGRRVEGAVPYESFKALIESQLGGGI
jgi:protein-disulfide isomerase